jgi:hypothetical protein
MQTKQGGRDLPALFALHKLRCVVFSQGDDRAH